MMIKINFGKKYKSDLYKENTFTIFVYQIDTNFGDH